VGYRAPVKAYRLKFADEDMAGLEVTARSLPIGEFLKLSDLAGLAQDDPAAMSKGATETFRVLAGALMSWNLEDEQGQPVPATYEGIVSQDLDFVMKIVNAWMSAMTDVAPPLPGGSSGGVPSALEQSIPMAPPSDSPPS
jgi:hypothetical protein